MTARRACTLESRLTEWAREYGGSRYENTGWQGVSPLAALMKYHGRPPDGLNVRGVAIRTAADEVQAAIMALGRQKAGIIPAQVVRAEYLAPGQPVDSKLQKLRRLGYPMDRVRYSQHLRHAKIYIAGVLLVFFSDEVDEVA